MKNRRGATANHMLWWFVNGGGWLLSTEVVDVNRGAVAKRAMKL